tara:strand:- start:665 stop:775 length:111 start_codon:yes stop_codon:yes gene_type:complete
VDRREVKQLLKEISGPALKIIIAVLLYGWLCREFIL